MARLLVEDSSDDEFPNVNEIFQGPRRKEGEKKTSTTSEPRKQIDKRVRANGQNEFSGSGSKNTQTPIIMEIKELGKNGSSGAEHAKPKPRKRVLLKQTSDVMNPLLKPLSTTKALSLEESKRKIVVKSVARKPEMSEESSKQKAAPERPKIAAPEEDEDESDDAAIRRQILSDNLPSRKTSTKVPIALESTEEDDEDESEDLSDFIVEDDEDSDVFMPPPKSTRKLVRGRRPKLQSSDSEEDTLAELLHKTSFKDKAGFPDLKPPKKNEIRPGSSSSFDDPGAVLRFSPSASRPRKVSKEIRPSTPPKSPESKPRGLASPKKLPRIPSTPHRPSMDSFWSQDAVNDWNDQYSPMKTLQPIPKAKLPAPSTSGGGLLFSPKKPNPTKDERITKGAKKAFSTIKHDLATDFLTELDTKITSGRIAQLSASTGGVKIVWSKKLNTTAGRANWKRETIKFGNSGMDGKPLLVTYRHHASIELAEKVIDDEDRLLNVLAHEFCHLANFMVSNIKTNPHGKEFKEWAAKCSAVFGDRGIEVTTKHSYEIDYKYVWECVEEGCGSLFKRHSKSIDLERHRCGSCKGKLIQIKPVPRGKGVGKESDYQVFFKANLKIIKEENPGSPQKEIMGLVGKRWEVFKASKTKMGETSAGKEGTPDDGGMEAVSRKLDFLDLTSP